MLAPTEVASAISVLLDHLCSGFFGRPPEEEEVPVRPRFSSSNRCAWSLASRVRASSGFGLVVEAESRGSEGEGGDGGAGWEASDFVAERERYRRVGSVADALL